MDDALMKQIEALAAMMKQNEPLAAMCPDGGAFRGITSAVSRVDRLVAISRPRIGPCDKRTLRAALARPACFSTYVG